MPVQRTEEFFKGLLTNNDPRSLRGKLVHEEKRIEAMKDAIKQTELYCNAIKDKLYLIEVQKEQPEDYRALDNFVDLVLEHFIGEQGGFHPDEQRERVEEIIDNAKRARVLFDLPDAPYGNRRT